MSKIIEASKKILNNDKESLEMLESIVNNLSETRFDFMDIDNVKDKKELICGYIVYYSVLKTKVKAKNSAEDQTLIQVIVHGVFRPLDQARVVDSHIIDMIGNDIKNRNL